MYVHCTCCSSSVYVYPGYMCVCLKCAHMCKAKPATLDGACVSIRVYIGAAMVLNLDLYIRRSRNGAKFRSLYMASNIRTANT